MTDLFDQSLRDVLRVAASSEPVPGGGSVSAIAAAFAASMAAMVGSLTIGKKKYRDVEAQVTSIRDRALALISRSEDLMNDDMGVFNKFMGHYKMTATTSEEKVRKESLIQGALKDATETPLEIARACVEILEIVQEIAVIGNKMAISDAGVSAYLAEAALKAVLLNVDINVPQIKDSEFVKRAKDEKQELITKAETLRASSLETVSARIGS